MKKLYLGLILILTLFIPGLICAANPIVTIKSELGNIVMEIHINKAPITAKNFLKYVKKGLFNNTVFHRTVTMANQPANKVKIEVIQAQGAPWKDTFDSIILETTDKTTLLHKDGTISMARGKPNSARSSFFICINDQPQLDFGGKRNPDGQGFAAFGQVIEGMDIVRKIQNSPAEEQKLVPPIKIHKVYVKK